MSRSFYPISLFPSIDTATPSIFYKFKFFNYFYVAKKIYNRIIDFSKLRLDLKKPVKFDLNP